MQIIHYICLFSHILFFMKYRICIVILLGTIGLQVFSQESAIDSSKHKIIPQPYYRNVIKINPTPTIVFGDVSNLTLCYERLIKNDQSIAFQAGYFFISNLFGDTIAGLIKMGTNPKHTGYNLAFDYRYYPNLRNRRPAPDGLFIGGYVSYNGFKFDNDFYIFETGLDNYGTINARSHYINLGFDLGYQFVFWKRLTVDFLVFGPSVSYSQSNGSIDGNLTQGEIEVIDEELRAKLMEKFPLLTTIFSEESLVFSRSQKKVDIGFRYSIAIGFHF